MLRILIGHTYLNSSLIGWKYLSGLLVLPSWTIPFIDTFTMIQQNEYIMNLNSIVASGIMIIIYTEMVLFFSIFGRMSYGENTYLQNSSSFVVIGVIIILSCSSISNTLFATLLCKELVSTNLTKLFFNITGLHFTHVIVGYFLLLHVGEHSEMLTEGSVNTVSYIQTEVSFTYLYWLMVEGLWLIIDSLVFCLF